MNTCHKNGYDCRLLRNSAFYFGLLLTIFFFLISLIAVADAQEISDSARTQIQALLREKATRIPAQLKMDSQLVYAAKQHRKETIAAGVTMLQTGVKFEPDGRILVDIDANVTTNLLAQIEQVGAKIINSFPQFHAIRAVLPVDQIEGLAGSADVRFIKPAVRSFTNTGNIDSQGDVTHRADQARGAFGVTGAGVNVGVLSDSVTYLANSQATGELGPVTVLPGQAGSGAGEGTAMLEIIHDLAPGAGLYFATAFNGEASFAQNILNLQAAGCNIIVDDVSYYDESPFQDGIIAQAVNSVTAQGVLYFSSAGNSGNKNDGTSGTWEGDFADGGAVSSPEVGRIHNFGGGTNYNVITTSPPSGYMFLFWSDPLGASTNDYDLFVLNSTGTSVLFSSTTRQNGTQDPIEYVYSGSTSLVGDRLVIVKYSGDARFLHVDTFRGRLQINTPGNTHGHNAAAAAFCVAAVSALTSYPNPFSGGAANPIETFSSDGPRRIFYSPDGTPITPGNFLSSGGTLLQKPDIAAADGVTTSVPGFGPFYGTSAAAPHAAAIAALLESYNNFLSASEIHTALTNTALDIEAPGVDRDSGAGIVMALQALQAVPGAPNAIFTSASFGDASGGNGNGYLDPGETIQETVIWNNVGGAAATNVTASLSTAAAGVTVTEPVAAYPDISVAGSSTNITPFTYRLAKTVSCGTTITFTNILATGGRLFTGAFTHVVGQVQNSAFVTNTFDSSNVPKTIPDVTTIYSTNSIATTGVIDDVNVTVRLNHTYDGDLTIAIQHPDSTEVVLAEGRGGSGDNFGTGTCGAGEVRTTFDDEAANPISAGSAPFAGSFRPEGVLTNLDSKPVNGTWRLRVTDSYLLDTGTLYCWGLRIISHQQQYVCSVFNNAPVASNQTITISVNTATNLVLTGSDPDGDPISFGTNSLPAHGTLSNFNPSTGAITYTPANNYSGSDSFTFVVNDGMTNSAPAAVSMTITEPPSPWQQWQLNYFGCANCSQAAEIADPDGDGQNNLAEFLVGTDPTNSASAFRIIGIAQEGDDVRVTWATAGGRTNVLQATGSLLGVFFNISPNIVIAGVGDVVTNYLDKGAATNATCRFYRVAAEGSSIQDSNAPTLTITSPANNSYTTNSTITVAGTSADASGVAGVDVHGIAASSANGYSNWAAEVSGLAEGTNTLTVLAGDNAAPANIATDVVRVIYATGSFDGNGDGLPDVWQIQYFGSVNAPGSGPNDDPDGDGLNNLQEWLAGTNPTNSASTLRIIGVTQEGDDVRVAWTTAGGRTNAVQAAAGDANGNYDTNYVDISGLIIVSGTGDTTTNYVDVGGATNAPSRFYRVRLVP
ncbi:MAG: Ig-like domain-containing protein [Verrucomicrobiia bacterium]